jgi:hypothetical protein
MNAQKIKLCLFSSAVIFLFAGCNSNNQTKNYSNYNNYNSNNSRVNSTPTNQPFNQQEFYENQLSVVRREKFKKNKLVNKSEMELLEALEKALSSKGYRIMVQTSYGAFLGHDDKEVYFQVHSKRADFVVMNRFGYPEMVIEYNGEGHYQSNSSLKDDIKELSVQSANIPFVKITYNEKYNNFESAIKTKVIPNLYKKPQDNNLV